MCLWYAYSPAINLSLMTCLLDKWVKNIFSTHVPSYYAKLKYLQIESESIKVYQQYVITTKINY